MPHENGVEFEPLETTKIGIRIYIAIERIPRAPVNE